ncbi:hypothetical protein LTR17_020969 [Elasticomyces elasticus]|nr:hypothetical protein LTR17_020969 [Elasticomyces elasticus]
MPPLSTVEEDVVRLCHTLRFISNEAIGDHVTQSYSLEGMGRLAAELTAAVFAGNFLKTQNILDSEAQRLLEYGFYLTNRKRERNKASLTTPLLYSFSAKKRAAYSAARRVELRMEAIMERLRTEIGIILM